MPQNFKQRSERTRLACLSGQLFLPSQRPAFASGCCSKKEQAMAQSSLLRSCPGFGKRGGGMETCGASPWKDRPASGTRRIYASSSISWRKECRRSTWLPLPGFALTEPQSRPTCVVFADAMSAPKTEVIGLLHGHLLLPHLLSHYLSHQQVLVPKCWAKKRDGQKGTTQQSRHECRETNEGWKSPPYQLTSDMRVFLVSCQAEQPNWQVSKLIHKQCWMSNFWRTEDCHAGSQQSVPFHQQLDSWRVKTEGSKAEKLWKNYPNNPDFKKGLPIPTYISEKVCLTEVFNSIPQWNLVVHRYLSFSKGVFSGCMLVFGSVFVPAKLLHLQIWRLLTSKERICVGKIERKHKNMEIPLNQSCPVPL